MKNFLTILLLSLTSTAVFAEGFKFEKKLELAKKGDASAQNEIGEYFADGGQGKFPPDYMTASTWWEVAAKNGSASRGSPAAFFVNTNISSNAYTTNTPKEINSFLTLR